MKTKDTEYFVRKFKASLDSISYFLISKSHFLLSFLFFKKVDFGIFRSRKSVSSHRLLLFHLYFRGRIRFSQFTLYLFFPGCFLCHINPTLPNKLLLNQVNLNLFVKSLCWGMFQSSCKLFFVNAL